MVVHSMGSPTWQEDHVEADGFRIRYVQAGDGAPLVHLHGGGGLAITPAHDLLARDRRVIAFEMPGFGDSPENTRHQTMNDMAGTMLAAVTALGIDGFDLMGTSFGGKTALCAALIAGERVPPRSRSAIGDRAKVGPMMARVMAPPRDAELEAAMAGLQVPVLVIFGTEDRLIAPETGRTYKQLLPNCHLLYVYDAGHATAADRPEAFAEAVADFLERHEQYVVSQRSSVLFP